MFRRRTAEERRVDMERDHREGKARELYTSGLRFMRDDYTYPSEAAPRQRYTTCGLMPDVNFVKASELGLTEAITALGMAVYNPDAPTEALRLWRKATELDERSAPILLQEFASLQDKRDLDYLIAGIIEIEMGTGLPRPWRRRVEHLRFRAAQHGHHAYALQLDRSYLRVGVRDWERRFGEGAWFN